MNGAQHGLIWAVRIYRAVLSPILTAVFGPLGFGCRFEPTCSRYALEAIQIHGAVKGSCLSLRRLCRCHPWGGCGYDPVPPVNRKKLSLNCFHLRRHAPLSATAVAHTSLPPPSE